MKIILKLILSGTILLTNVWSEDFNTAIDTVFNSGNNAGMLDYFTFEGSIDGTEITLTKITSKQTSGTANLFIDGSVGKYTIVLANSAANGSASHLFNFPMDGTTYPAVNLTIDNIKAPTNCGWLFNGCYNLQSVKFGRRFDTTQVTTMQAMFNWCRNITSLDLSNFKTTNVSNMMEMFYSCQQ